MSWKTVNGVFLATLLASFMGSAIADPVDDIGAKIDPADVCKDGMGVVDKAKLASRLQEQYELSDVVRRLAVILATRRQTGIPQAEQAAWQVALETPELCENSVYSADLACSKKEMRRTVLLASWVRGDLLKNNVPGFKFIGPQTSSYDYFGGSASRLVCEKPPEKDHSKRGFQWQSMRARGYSEQLVYAHGASDGGDDTHAKDLYNSSDGASLSFKYNGAQKSRADSLVAAIGYDFDLKQGQNIAATRVPLLDLIPYVAVDRELKTDSHSTTLSSNTIETGGLLSAFVTPRGDSLPFLGQYVTAEAGYVFNLQDDSRLGTLKFRYIPMISGGLNSTQVLIPDLLTGFILADARFNLGDFFDEGTPPDPKSGLIANESYIRLGGRIGASFELTLFPNYPIDAYAFYTDFAHLKGLSGDLGEFQQSLTFNFGKDKLFGLTASYRNGRREDTAQRDQSWNVGLTIKY